MTPNPQVLQQHQNIFGLQKFMYVYTSILLKGKKTFTLLVENLKYTKAALLLTAWEKTVIYQIKSHDVVGNFIFVINVWLMI